MVAAEGTDPDGEAEGRSRRADDDRCRPSEAGSI
jgi:hypothetical protein